MSNPRDPVPQFGIPVDLDTGLPLTDRQAHHLASIREASEMLFAMMHEAEGSALPGHKQEHVFMSRRMNIAADHIETALMFARKAALEAP